MEKIEEHNKNSMSYVPTFEEMKLSKEFIHRMETEWDDPIKSVRNDREYEAHVKRWQEKHRASLTKKTKQKKERKDQNFMSHWYVLKSDGERIKLIEETRVLADAVMDEVIKGLTIASLINHAEGLRASIKSMPVTLDAASNDKLRRFPKYSLETESLEGGSSSFYRLWSHVFRMRKTSKFNPRKEIE